MRTYLVEGGADESRKACVFFSVRRLAQAASVWLLLNITNASFSAVLAQDLGALEQALRTSGYQLYNPPRANWGPGFVFAGEVVGSQIKTVEEICPNLNGNDLGPPQEAAIALASESFSIWSGALATAGGVVFYGTLEGYLKAVNSKSGNELYRFKTVRHRWKCDDL